MAICLSSVRHKDAGSLFPGVTSEVTYKSNLTDSMATRIRKVKKKQIQVSGKQMTSIHKSVH